MDKPSSDVPSECNYIFFFFLPSNTVHKIQKMLFAEGVLDTFKKEKVETQTRLSSGHWCHLDLYLMFIWLF